MTTKFTAITLTLLCLLAACYSQNQQLLPTKPPNSITSLHVVVTRIEYSPTKEKKVVAKGSGIVIGQKTGRTYILTANHIRYSGQTKEGYTYRLGIRLRLEGPSITARIERFSKYGLDAIIISTPALDYPVARISQTDPEPGEELFILGSPTGSYRTIYRRRASEYRRTRPSHRLQYRVMEFILDGSILNGFSGGGVYNSRRELAGMCYRHVSVTDDTGVCLPISALRELIQQYQ